MYRFNLQEMPYKIFLKYKPMEVHTTYSVAWLRGNIFTLHCQSVTHVRQEYLLIKISRCTKNEVKDQANLSRQIRAGKAGNLIILC